jgi:MFS family permease
MSSMAVAVETTRRTHGSAPALVVGADPRVGPVCPPVESGPRLLNRNFLLLWQAQLVSQFGNQAFTIALMVWTLETTHSATASGLMMMASVLPLVVLAPLTGTFVDRQRSRLRIITTCDLASGVLVSLLAAGFMAGPPAWRPAMLFAIALLIGVCNAFFDPAVNAFVPDLVPRDRIEAANAFRQSSRQVTVLVAQGLGGILYALLGPAMLFLLDGLSFLFAGATETLIRHTPVGNPVIRRQSTISNITDGFRYIAAQPGMTGFLITTSLFNAMLVPMSLLLPVYATEHLQAGVRWYGFLLAAISAGAIAGCALAGATRLTLSGSSRRSLLIGAFAALALALAVAGQIESRWIALAIMFVTGVLSGIINVLVISIEQRRTSEEFRGRVLGLHTMMTRLLQPIALLVGGALADLTGRNVSLVYGICGSVALASVILLAGRRSTREFLASS